MSFPGATSFVFGLFASVQVLDSEEFQNQLGIYKKKLCSSARITFFFFFYVLIR